MGGALASYQQGSLGYYVYSYLDVINASGTVVFALITGFISKPDEHIRVKKLAYMWLQVLFYSVLSYVLVVTVYKQSVSVKSLIPVSGGHYWYFTAYFGLMLVKPLLDKALFAMNDKELRIMAFIVILMGTMSTMCDGFNFISGYSFVWICMLYCLGYAIKRISLNKKISNSSLIICFFIAVTISFIALVFAGLDRIFRYTSPGLVIAAIAVLILASRFDKNIKFLDKIVPLVFGVYLFQCAGFVWHFMSDKLSQLSQYNLLFSLVIVTLSIVVLFVAGAVFEALRKLLFKIIGVDRFCELLEKKVYKVVANL